MNEAPPPPEQQSSTDAAMRKAYPLFLEHQTRALRTLQESISHQDWIEAARIAHGWKGSAACFGFSVLAYHIQVFEDYIKDHPSKEEALKILVSLELKAEDVAKKINACMNEEV